MGCGASSSPSSSPPTMEQVAPSSSASSSALPPTNPPVASIVDEDDPYAVDMDEVLDDLDAEFGIEDIAIGKSGKEEQKLEEMAHASEDQGDDEELDIGEGEAVSGEFQSVKPWLGAIFPPTNWEKPSDQDEAPHAQLTLEYVYGVRSRDCHRTIFQTTDGRIVYCTAAVGIVLDPITHEQRYFMGHDNDILCLAYHPGSNLVVTGQIGHKPSLFVWDATTCELVAELKNVHQRGVIACDFSPDGQYVASVGLDDQHSVVVWSTRSGKRIAQEKGDVSRILEISFIGENEFITTGNKHFRVWTIAGNKLSCRKGIFGNTAPRQTICSGAAVGGKVITGALDGSLYTWNGNTLTSSQKVHKGAVYCVRCINGVFYSGAKDGILCVYEPGTLRVSKKFDLNQVMHTNADSNHIKSIDTLDGQKIVVGTYTSQIVLVDVDSGSMEVVIEGHHGILKTQDSYGEVWGLTMHPTDPNIAISCADDGTVRIWNMETKSAEIVLLPGPARCVDISPDGDLLAVGFLDFSLGVFDMKGTSLVHHNFSRRPIAEAKFSPDGSYIAFGTHDSNVIILSRESGWQRIGNMNKHSSAVKQIDWASDGSVIQSCDAAGELLFTSTDNFKQNPSSSTYRDTEWQSYTTVLGWPVQGIWPEFSKQSDINAVDRNHSRDVLATAEDSGLVKLFRFPCLGSGFDRRGKLRFRPSFHAYSGHSEHVTKVRFAVDDSRLVSTGGADLSVFQWRVVA